MPIARCSSVGSARTEAIGRLRDTSQPRKAALVSAGVDMATCQPAGSGSGMGTDVEWRHGMIDARLSGMLEAGGNRGRERRGARPFSE